ncbi:unnamed protein product [Rangifer tarandus platyrhynchus]|uniref:Uncharacterized protein n=2 Tax=Rangifer tarandus platyrhynchus TaxID=3082113 RepID=A0ABN8YX59_RANTA|nr:unnamed protein product [Rangifer tarandus platyrhynchus]
MELSMSKAVHSQVCSINAVLSIPSLEILCVCVCVWGGGVLSCFSRDQLCVTLKTIDHQSPLSMGFSRQEYWSGLPFHPPGDLPNPRIKLTSLMSPPLAGEFFTTSTTWEAPISEITLWESYSKCKNNGIYNHFKNINVFH